MTGFARARLVTTKFAASSVRGASELKMVSEEEREEIELEKLAAIDPAGGLDDLLIFGSPATRRRFLKQVAGTGAAIGLGPGSVEAAPGATIGTSKIQLKIDGKGGSTSTRAPISSA